MLSEPRVVCAAVLFPDEDDLIIASPRHFDVLCRDVIDAAFPDRVPIPNYEEGFIDQHGKFYDRQYAWMIAALNGQIVKRVGGDGPEGHGLFSENLY